ncbi:MAG TPA: PASTA domain-containing protein, partial [Gaiellaceae bacterium]|nr:PASTA domain-containing protein [Gaiellaceae bacterium]
MSSLPPPSDSADAWPTRQETTLVTTRDDPAAPVGPPEPFVPPPADRRIGEGMLLGLAAVALVAIGIVVAYLFTHRSSTPSTTTVIVTSGPATTAAGASGSTIAPDVRGLGFPAARAQLQAAGFTTAETTAISERKAGTVLRQSPRAGARARRGSTVTLVVATAATTKAAPGSTAAQTTPQATTAATTAQSTTTTNPATTTAAAPPTP